MKIKRLSRSASPCKKLPVEIKQVSAGPQRVGKKMLNIKVDPDYLLKTKGQKNGSPREPDNYLKINRISKNTSRCWDIIDL